MVSERLIDTELSIGGGLTARVFALLAAIDREGSIVRAAKATGLSYKGAWQIIDRVNQLSPRPLIESVVGGGHTKGTRLTATGLALLAAFQHLQREKDVFLEKVNEEFSHDPLRAAASRQLQARERRPAERGGRGREHVGAIQERARERIGSCIRSRRAAAGSGRAAG